MELQVCEVLENGEMLLVNSKGCETIEINDLVNDIDSFSIDNKASRFIGINKKLFRLTMKSFKALKKEVNKRGIGFRFNNLMKR